MIIDGMLFEIMEFKSLYELLKIEQTHYILKFELDKDEAIYYMISDSPNFTLLGFCFDKNFVHENIKVENGQVIDSQELSGTTIVTVNVKEDTILAKVMMALYPEEKKPKKTKKK